jgi:hypothetical protein
MWEASSGRFIGAVKVPDGSGVAAGSTPGSLLMTSGRGGAWLWQRRNGSTVEIGGDYLNKCSGTTTPSPSRYPKCDRKFAKVGSWHEADLTGLPTKVRF